MKTILIVGVSWSVGSATANFFKNEEWNLVGTNSSKELDYRYLNYIDFESNRIFKIKEALLRIA